MKITIKELKGGEGLTPAVFLLKKKELLMTKENKPYLKLEFADRTGTIEGRLWEGAARIDRQFETGTAVAVYGTVELWRQNVQVKVEDMRPAAAQEYAIGDLIRSVENPEELFEKIKSCLRKNIANRWLSLLVGKLLDDAGFSAAFQKAPGAHSWHNAYCGGLMEHTYEVMVIVEKMCELYPEAQKDIALVGAFLHDIGKIYELDSTTFEYTPAGGLLGHLPIGYELVSDVIKSLKDFPEDVALHLKHSILAHHGEYEQQSPVLPKTLEAIIVYHADELVSQANAVKEVIASQATGDREWSNFISIKNRKFFLKRPDARE